MKKAIVLIIIILVIGAYLVKSYNDLDLKKSNDFKTFIKIYFGWVSNLFSNIKDVTGYATEKNWLPENSNPTNSSSD